LIPKIEARNFPADFCSRGVWGSENRHVATPLIVALSPVHTDSTRFRKWSPNATGNNLDFNEIIPNLLRRLAPFTFLFRLQAFRYSLPGGLRMSKFS